MQLYFLCRAVFSGTLLLLPYLSPYYFSTLVWYDHLPMLLTNQRHFRWGWWNCWKKCSKTMVQKLLGNVPRLTHGNQAISFLVQVNTGSTLHSLLVARPSLSLWRIHPSSKSLFIGSSINFHFSLVNSRWDWNSSKISLSPYSILLNYFQQKTNSQGKFCLLGTEFQHLPIQIYLYMRCNMCVRNVMDLGSGIVEFLFNYCFYYLQLVWSLKSYLKLIGLSLCKNKGQQLNEVVHTYNLSTGRWR
jgi:hypothetical protein